MKQLTSAQATAFYDSGEWKDWTDAEIVGLQLFQDNLCIDYQRYREALNSVLKRPVFTNELAASNIDMLVAEYLGQRPAPTLEKILDKIPEAKRITILSA